MSEILDHTLTLSSIARRNNTTVRKLSLVFGRLGIYPVGRIDNCNVYQASDVALAEQSLSTPTIYDKDVNSQSLGISKYLQSLLDNGHQEEYEAELQIVRDRREQLARARHATRRHG